MRAIAATIFALLCTPAFAQSAAFDAADVHPSPHRANPFPDGGFLRGDRYVYRQATLVDIIAAAYNMDAAKVLGGPSWLEADRFDIIAKAPSTTSPETVRLMLQSLLADRFKLVFHNGDQAQPAFVLSAGKGKPKLKQSEGDGDSNCDDKTPPSDPGSTEIPTIIVSCRYMSMEDFATALRNMAGGYLSSPVVDSTNLKGTWDFDLKWTPRGLLQRAGADGISIFDAVDKQLGLKLDLQTASRPAFIVDSADRLPTPNALDLSLKLPPTPPTQFDVATVKPSKPDANFTGKITGGLLDVIGAPLKFVIAYAWNLNPNSSEVPANAPKWLDTEKFDITAKVLTVAPTSGPKNTPAMDDQELREMIQTFLVDRFKMQAHMESRPITAYTLTAVNPKLRPADPASRTRCTEGPGPDGKDPRNTSTVLNRLVTCQNMTLAQIGDELQNLAPGYIYNQVLDATNIPGSWDFTLSFSSADQIKAAATSSDNGASDPNGALSDLRRRQQTTRPETRKAKTSRLHSGHRSHRREAHRKLTPYLNTRPCSCRLRSPLLSTATTFNRIDPPATGEYPKPMKVSAQYAEEHFADILDTANRGEEVEIARADQSSYRLTLVKPAPTKQSGRRILGAGVGEMIVPTWEEWKAMDKAIEREMCDAPLISTGEI